MKWATRPGVHIDRAACAWLIRRFIDRNGPTFVFTADLADVPADAVAFDMPGAAYSHHGTDCSFETFLRRHDLTDPVLWRIAALVHEADIDDGHYDAPEAPGFDLALRALSMVETDERVLELTGPLFDGVYEFFRRELLLGREPA
jgi:hypothetical protein